MRRRYWKHTASHGYNVLFKDMKILKKPMLCTVGNQMCSCNTVRRWKGETEECIDIYRPLCRKLTLSV